MSGADRTSAGPSDRCDCEIAELCAQYFLENSVHLNYKTVKIMSKAPNFNVIGIFARGVGILNESRTSAHPTDCTT